MSHNIGDEYSSDEVTVYKEEGEAEVEHVSGENFGADKVELLKEAEQISTKSVDIPARNGKETLTNTSERTTPAAHRQFNLGQGSNATTGSFFDSSSALSPSAASLFSASNPYAAILSASRFAMSPVTLGLLAAASSTSQQTSSPGPLSADQVSALMAAGVASPQASQLAAVARASPALAALQIAAALQPYSVNRTTGGSTTPGSTTPGMSSGDQLGAAIAAAGLQQLAAAAVAAAQSPHQPWQTNSNSSAASNWLYAAGHHAASGAGPVGGGIGSPATTIGGCGSPSSSLLARLSPALSTLSCLAAAANMPQGPPAAHNHPASFLLNAHQRIGDVPSPSSAASSGVGGVNYSGSSIDTNSTNFAAQSMATEVMLLRAAMMQQQQQQHHQQQQFAAALDAAHLAVAAANAANASNVPVTPRSKPMTIPTPTSRPRPQMDNSGAPLALTNPPSIAGAKRPHHSLAHQTTRPGDPQHSPMMHMPLLAAQMPQQQQQQPQHPNFHQLQQLTSPGQHPVFGIDPRRQMGAGPQHMSGNMVGHNGGHQHGHHHRSRSPVIMEPHVKKPLNAFMLFMKEQRAQVIAECTLKESAAINQILGQRWHNLSRDEQARYYDLAKAEKERHQKMYPNWSARENYASHTKRKRRRKVPGFPGSTGQLGGAGLGDGLKDVRDSALKKCRARYGVDQMDKWCKPCRRKKKCARYYNLPGDDDDNDGPGDAKSTPSSHLNLPPGTMPQSATGTVGVDLNQRYGMGEDDDEWTDSASSVGDSIDDDDDEEQLNAFHLVSESSSSASTPSPSPAIMAPLSPSSSIHSSASHRQQPGYHHNHHHALNMIKMAPMTPVSSGLMPNAEAYQQLLQQQQQPQQQSGYLNDGTGVANAPPSAASAGTANSTDVAPLSSTPPSSTSAAAQHLCSPTSTANGIAFRPLLPAN